MQMDPKDQHRRSRLRPSKTCPGFSFDLERVAPSDRVDSLLPSESLLEALRGLLWTSESHLRS